MTALLYVSAIALLVAAAVATVVYARAVVHSHRAYAHVILAGAFVLVIEAVALLNLPQGVLLVANLVGIGAMVALAARFRSQSQHERLSPGGSLYEWYRARRGFVAWVVGVIIVGVGFVVVQGIAENAEDAAMDAERAAEQAERSGEENRRLAAANSRLNCGFAKLIRGSPIVRRPEETPEAFTRRIVIIREFAHDVRLLGILLDRFNLERGAKCNVTDLRVRLTPADRAALVPEILDRARGGDAVGPSPGGGGQPGGDEPPPDDSLLGPTLDEVCDLADAVADVC